MPYNDAWQLCLYHQEHVVLRKCKKHGYKQLYLYMKFVSEIDVMGYGHLCSEQAKILDQPKNLYL
jgi:hypothetical protein